MFVFENLANILTVTRVLIGHENSLLHARTTFALRDGTLR